ncbi:hypothetical protein C1H76_4607 [Elsinoe australis]|uniref:Uncharacterized protein n=1 Tax=Elsinoe australis TaxID=40998 RepID=A0A4U7B0P0_9PEZI|nr:hypothetical protein C1H76_4607 [Elsinoe australis]
MATSPHHSNFSRQTSRPTRHAIAPDYAAAALASPPSVIEPHLTRSRPESDEAHSPNPPIPKTRNGLALSQTQGLHPSMFTTAFSTRYSTRSRSLPPVPGLPAIQTQVHQSVSASKMMSASYDTRQDSTNHERNPSEVAVLVEPAHKASTVSGSAEQPRQRAFRAAQPLLNMYLQEGDLVKGAPAISRLDTKAGTRSFAAQTEEQDVLTKDMLDDALRADREVMVCVLEDVRTNQISLAQMMTEMAGLLVHDGRQ